MAFTLIATLLIGQKSSSFPILVISGILILISFSLTFSNWIVGRFILKTKLQKEKAWRLSFVTSGYYGLLFLIISLTERKPFGEGGVKVVGYLIGSIIAIGLVVLVFGVINYLGILLSNKIFKNFSGDQLTNQIKRNTLDSLDS